MTQLRNTEPRSTSSSEKQSWQQLTSRVSAAYGARLDSESAMADLLRPAAHQLYNWIAEVPGFRRQLSHCPDKIGEGVKSWSSMLFANKHIKVGLQAVYQGNPIPLHDHPGSAGVVLVLSGVVNFQYADVTRYEASPGLVELQIACIRNRLAGQVCWFHAEDRNIHRVEAKTDRAIMLVMHLRQSDAGPRHMYFPVSEYETVEGIRLLAHRMKILRKQSESSEIN